MTNNLEDKELLDKELKEIFDDENIEQVLEDFKENEEGILSN